MTTDTRGNGGARVLYITYDGLTDPLGRSQVLPYLTGLSRLGHRITILSCEKRARLNADRRQIADLCDAANIQWQPLAYHKQPPILSSMYDARALRHAAERLHRVAPFDLVHCRSYIPAMVGRHLKRRFRAKFLFDMRGFWPDERVDGNGWPQSNPVFRAVYTFFKRVEARLLCDADHIISLTFEGQRQLLTRPQFVPQGPEITVIPCCVDFEHFPLVRHEQRQAARASLGITSDAKVVAYLGSVGTWYMADEMLDFFRVCLKRSPNAVFLFVTPDEPEALRAAARARGVPEDRLVIRAASREQVPQFMAAADFGLFFIKPVFSKLASSPTKMGEMLALGLPLVANAGVGDVAQIVEETECGVAIDRFDEASYSAALDQIERMSPAPEDQRRRALPWFDVRIGIARYDAVYRSLSGARD